MPSVDDLPHLLRLLDDRDPAVRPVVREKISGFGGDISHDLAALGVGVPPAGRKRLIRLLGEGRRETLRKEWQAPGGGAAALADDWEGFESILRQVSDFLHDGITLRPSLSDSLDLLADELRGDLPPAPGADDLRRRLFGEAGFAGVKGVVHEEWTYDLCRVIDARQGNPISLALLFMLAGHRLGVEVEGCDYPGRFLVKIPVEGRPCLVDCSHASRCFDLEAFAKHSGELSEEARRALLVPAHLGETLVRYISELETCLKLARRPEDSALFKKLLETL